MLHFYMGYVVYWGNVERVWWSFEETPEL